MFLKSPKSIIIAGAVVLAALIGLTAREVVLRRAARTLPPIAVDLSPEKRKALEEKVAASRVAIAAKAEDFNAHVELALSLTDLGDRDGAAEVYRQMNQRFSGNYLSYSNLGKLYEDAGKYDFAAEQYLIAIQNAPRNPHLYRNIVNLYTYQAKERASDIPRILQKGLLEMPGSIDLMSMLAVYYRDHGQRDEAIRWFEHLLVFDQTNTTALEEVKDLKSKK